MGNVLSRDFPDENMECLIIIHDCYVRRFTIT